MSSTVLAAQQRDPAAFTTLVERWASPVCAILMAILRDPVRSEDAAQEVFLQAWRDLPKLENPDSFGPWIRQLARHRGHDLLRHTARRKEDELHEDTVDPHSPLDTVERRQREGAVWTALDALPSDHREVLVLFYREGRSVQQVAELLELQPATVRKRMSRARDLLRADVGEVLGEQLARTRPGAAFVAGVGALVSASLPSTAQAAVTATGLKTLGLGAGIGATGGLLGVWLGHRQALAHTPEADRRALVRQGILQALAVLVATGLMAWLDGLVGNVLGMVVLAVVMAGTILSWPLHRVRTLGLSAGLFFGTLGAAAGLASDGLAPFTTALAVHLQAHAFLTVPLVLAWVLPVHLGLARRWSVMGAVSWLLALPVLAAGPALAQAVSPSTFAPAIGLSLAAGIGEETSRALVYAGLQRWTAARSGRHAILLGIGHGGVEAVLFGVGGLFALTAGVQDAWMHGLFGVSRLLILTVHVGFTLLVWRAVTERRASFWLLAVGAHIALDLLAFVLPQLLPDASFFVTGPALLAMAGGSLVLARRALSAA